MAVAIAPATAPCWHQDRSGAQSPRPAPAPPLAGASRPPGRALASASPGPAGLQGTVPRGRGKRGSRFLFPPELMTAPSPLQWQGPSPLPQRPAGIRTGRGPKPPASARPTPGGRWPLCLPDLPIYRTPSHAGGENAMRFPFPPAGAVPCPGSESLSRQSLRPECGISTRPGRRARNRRRVVTRDLRRQVPTAREKGLLQSGAGRWRAAGKLSGRRAAISGTKPVGSFWRARRAGPKVRLAEDNDPAGYPLCGFPPFI